MTYRATSSHAGLGVRKGDERRDLAADSVEVVSGLFRPVGGVLDAPDYAERVASLGGGWYQVGGEKVRGYDEAVALARGDD